MIEAVIALIIIILEALLVRKITSSKHDIHAETKPINISNKTEDFNYPYYMNTALINLRSQGEQYLFAGGYNKPNKLYLIKNERLIDVSNQVGLRDSSNITHCVIAVDVNNDDFPDLFVAQNDGFYFYENRQGIFNIKKLNIEIDKNLIPISMAITDTQQNGLIDLFVTAYSKKTDDNQLINHYQSFLFKNKGDNTFEIFKK
ncbi:protein containing FG-GAP repeats (motif found in alpha integrins) [Legionella busanensis]|uniref:Protein containing FG-GAP repeats (Motif found in alpha integrins) n=1 Tax=Legionella busanensis TaxID=190655 RepID=A0A378JKV8_9GAMM|nr:VCBS repeat-containing protein [Legionella busanensis]STX50859.1 protein containing FG-GAP repeats (motif found in alpha integrins) [Legionella busanensis]